MQKIHRNIRVTGLVQGVWFRKSTQEQAQRLGVQGFVRNEMDGSVYIEVEGGPEEMEQFIAWCHRGPELASVEKVIVTEGNFQGMQGFRVVH